MTQFLAPAVQPEDDADLDRPLRTFSGGELTRGSLARTRILYRPAPSAPPSRPVKR